MIRRGEVWLVQLDPTVGSELRKTRPCVVVSPDNLSHLPVHVIVPLTSGSRPSSFRPEVRFGGKEGRLLIEQIRSVDRSRMLRKLGKLPSPDMLRLLAVLREMFED
ncbi:type II toxin-antitoxin system PemK/MazF family toxin [Brevundimonas sp. SL130]|uniref:type II toxin-antitoxin system PemK/MazF family toxin n=1 Tax=Brevundimonas sp. SL130 TaxID=2995143 RepID=UPI00226C8ABA|nr:type II toxin-antitoxin system PemK/MazF family toxin [Brevundimonas sp. SL130]WAC61034.1 type II toxin-antitoxin system PemK/MazF family toxin [Brevundimonas sp. SL130]